MERFRRTAAIRRADQPSARRSAGGRNRASSRWTRPRCGPESPRRWPPSHRLNQRRRSHRSSSRKRSSSLRSAGRHRPSRRPSASPPGMAQESRARSSCDRCGFEIPRRGRGSGAVLATEARPVVEPEMAHAPDGSVPRAARGDRHAGGPTRPRRRRRRRHAPGDRTRTIYEDPRAPGRPYRVESQRDTLATLEDAAQVAADRCEAFDCDGAAR